MPFMSSVSYRDVVTIDPGDKIVDPFVRHSAICAKPHQMGRYPEAKALYIRSLDVDPSVGNAHLNLGNIAFREQQWMEGVYHYER